MRSIILTFVSILIVGIIFGIILILVGGKCTPGDPSCDNNTASYQQNKYNNKWLNNNKLYYDNLNIYQIYIKRNQTKLFIKHAIKYGKLTKQLAVAIVINNKPRILEI